MNPQIEKIPETGSQRRIGSGGGSNLAGGKTRRHSVCVTSSQKSTGEEGNIIPNYLRASTGSCHDFCKFGKKHEHSKSTVPIKFKRTTVVNKDKVVPKTVVPLERKKPSTKPEIQMRVEPVKITKKDVLLLSSKKPQVNKQSSSTNGKTTKNEVKIFHKSSPVVTNCEGSNGGIKQEDINIVKKTGITPKTGTVKKVVAKVTPNESQSPKASFSRAASLKVVKSRGVKRVTLLKDQNRKQQNEPKQTIADKNVVEEEVKPETMEFDLMQSSMELVNPPVCNSSDSLSDKNVVEEEAPVIHPVYESSELFSDKGVLEELLVVETSKSCSDQEVLEEEALIAPPMSESSESFYDDEVLENESDYTDDEEADNINEMETSVGNLPRKGKMVISEDKDDEAIKLRFNYDDEVLENESNYTDDEEVNINEMETSVGSHKIPRKGKMVISEEKDEAVKLKFRRGKILDIQSKSNTPRRLKFRRRLIDGNEISQNISRKTYKNKTLDDLQNEEKEKQRVSRRSFEKKYVEERNESNNGHESVVLKHQIEQEKKDAQGLLNNVIEETASKLVESRKSKVKALVGAFETVISLQDGKPSSG